jgi:hypothetical protein
VLVDISSISYEKFISTMTRVVSDLYSIYSNVLLASALLNESQKKLILKTIEFEILLADLERSLLKLSELLHRHYGTPCMIFIDEYDKPYEVAAERKYLEDCNLFMAAFLGSVIKVSPLCAG